ncbi:MAG: hypothetical protein HKN30_11950 [Sulfitobacter sp.]|nr:hypothetical protein [Sulfitobacter sp.]
MTNSNAVMGLVAALVAVQLFDIAIHVGTGQAEPLRLLSNGVLGIWALWISLGRETGGVGLLAIALYLALHGIYIALHGVTNPVQGGALRVPLLALVGLSTVLGLWLNARAGRD